MWHAHIHVREVLRGFMYRKQSVNGKKKRKEKENRENTGARGNGNSVKGRLL